MVADIAAMTTLVEAFRAGRKANPKTESVTEAALAEVVAQGVLAWPAFAVDRVQFAEYLGARFAFDELKTAPVGDLYLAFACLAHEPRAIVELDVRLRRECERLEARHRGNVNSTDLVLELHSRLLLGDKPRLGEYQGRGSLGGWLAATAVRAALNLKREGDRRKKREEAVHNTVSKVHDPELELLRAKSRDVFNEVFREVLTSLDAKERALLRLHVVEGMGIDRIARVQNVGRSTAARWLASIRGKLLEQTRRLLGARLSIGSTTLDELLPVLTSDLDVSIRKVLSQQI